MEIETDAALKLYAKVGLGHWLLRGINGEHVRGHQEFLDLVLPCGSAESKTTEYSPGGRCRADNEEA